MSDPRAATAPVGAPALRLLGISKRFGEVRANTDISLTLAQGEILGLLGENGAGKTTLISILFGHYVADTGQIEVFGKPLSRARSARRLRRALAWCTSISRWQPT